jgi:dTDP-4-amino-4,6-dideoxygalactose transaminase
VPGSSSGEELAGAAMPDSFLTQMGPLQARLAARRLTGLPARIATRRRMARHYSAWAAAHGRTPAYEPDAAGHAFLRYAIRVRDRDAFVAEADRRGILIGDWFHSPLYPIEGDLSAWGYRRGEHPVAERVVSEIVNLPTDLVPDGPEARAIDALLDAWVDKIR